MLAVLQAGLGLRLGAGRVATARGWAAPLALALIAYAWLYPHFLEGHGWAAYLVAAPLGLVPCPTLSAIIGVTLLLEGLGSRGLSWMLAIAGLFYGIVGVGRLGVVLDVGLLVGAAALGVQAALGARATARRDEATVA